MSSNNTVVVTIQADGFCEDFELPSSIPIQELKARLLEVLKDLDARKFSTVSSYALRCAGKGLLCEEHASLDDYGVLTGSNLEIVPQ